MQGAIKGIQPQSVAPRDNHYMAIDPDSIRKRAEAFSDKWGVKKNLGEIKESQTFTNEFFEVFGVDRSGSDINFEYSVSDFSGAHIGRIDVLWPGVLLIENKSPKKDLNATFQQAKRYYEFLNESIKPRYILCNNFHEFQLTDMQQDKSYEFNLKELSEKLSLFSFILENEHKKLTAKIVERPRAAVIPLLIASVMSFLLGFGASEIELDHEIHRIYRDMTGTEKAL